MNNLATLNDSAFFKLSRDILRGLGWKKGRLLPAKEVIEFFRMPLVRESTDGMFRTDEVWLCVFLRATRPLVAADIEPLTAAALLADVGYLLTVVFGEVTPDAEDELRDTLAQEHIRVVL